MGAETELPWVAAHASKQRMGPQDNGNWSEFPAGLRVLVVDDDRICLLILDRLLRECLYRVTTCERAVDALKILRDNRDGFDLVISDVHMPDMDGYKLLELVGLEMDLPVLMMSSNSETSAVMKGIKHGACDYLLKPVRIEELKNIWQHVIRRKQRDLDSDDQQHKPDEGADSLANDGADGASKSTKKRKDSLEEEDDVEAETEDPATSKKPRVVWSVELHQKFVNAVNSLGIDKAVPKRILELMDVRNLTRENVASHLQKYRLYLKRLSGEAYQGGGGLGAGYFGTVDHERFLSSGVGLVGDFRSQLPVHPLISSLHSGLFDTVSPNSADPIFLGQLATIQGVGSGLSGKPHFSGVPLLNSANALNCPASNGLDLKHMSGGVGGQVSSHVHNPLSTLSPGSGHMERPISQEANVLADHKNNTLLMQILQQQRSRSQMALPEAQRSNLRHAESGPALPKINNSLLALHSSSKPLPEMATTGNFSYEASNGLGPFRKNSRATELSGKDELSGLQSILSDQAGGNATFRFGTGLMNWHNQCSTIGQASNLSYLQEPKVGWTPNFGNDLVEGIDVKPLATSTLSAFEQSFGERDQVLKVASLESQAVSKVGALPEPFPPADDLLACYMKQQQQDMVSLTEGDAAEGYTLGNIL
ncbi:hypothetical protein GOP47_0014033 [Adiantum capillus-veneris]|uniref:Two-component response regulator n=1 Tax=Adiantum capillus-veneris TaxID=13818 RepID=A0A9D4ZF48_ADICA|nr:hypothetical protein GOP47_0013301 [Adiantum capillus-veneris]KAI5071782.1 hypothetical protein GOP47_0014033 [Adiantum capillus-veneris]